MSSSAEKTPHRRVAILGATGSIGNNAVAVVKAPEGADTAQPGAAAAAAEAQPDVIKKGKEEAAGDAKKAEEKK